MWGKQGKKFENFGTQFLVVAGCGAKGKKRKKFVEPSEIRVFRVWFSTLSIQQGLQEFWCSSWPRRPVIGRKEQGEQAKTLAGFWGNWLEFLEQVGDRTSREESWKNLDHFSQARPVAGERKRGRKPSPIWTKSEVKPLTL